MTISIDISMLATVILAFMVGTAYLDWKYWRTEFHQFVFLFGATCLGAVCLDKIVLAVVQYLEAA